MSVVPLNRFRGTETGFLGDETSADGNNLADTTVVPGQFVAATVTVDQKGRITAIASPPNNDNVLTVAALPADRGIVVSGIVGAFGTDISVSMLGAPVYHGTNTGTGNGGVDSITFGPNAITTGGADAVAIGDDAAATALGAVALGPDTDATAAAALAVGATAQATAADAVAVGSTANASAVGAVAIGSGAIGAVANGIAIGEDSTTAAIAGSISFNATGTAANATPEAGFPFAIGCTGVHSAGAPAAADGKLLMVINGLTYHVHTTLIP